ncbi:MAG: hypothetical protein DRN03_03405 [Thermoplasmata archaeon]|nr:MAG: hypothetical protein DRN03_03405 [Thermoplasmata archaeon]HDI42205.1 hypothetical protein [Candidatus Bathyarchaeota archaeon]
MVDTYAYSGTTALNLCRTPEKFIQNPNTNFRWAEAKMVIIIADTRESQLVISELRRLGAKVEERTISPGDYIVGEGFCVERKSFRDFLQSIYKKRLFEQVERLLEEYPQGCLLVEGDVGHELAYITNPRVFWGALAKLIISFSVPTVFTLDETQTAHFLISLASKLQEEGREEVEARYKPKLYSLAYRQRFVVQGLPGIGPKLADRLLKTFGSVRGVFMASESMLTRVKGFGRKRAREITLLLDAPYEGATKKLA